MEIHHAHSLDVVEIDQFNALQNSFSKKVSLKNSVCEHSIKYCAGVDVAYWEERGGERAVCSIIVIDYESKEIVEKTSSFGEINIPYVPGYLAFRELPLIIEAAKKLVNIPDLFMFDGNGYLHPRHMGIATHASFFLKKPTIGAAKSYFKIDDVDFKMPVNETGSYEDIIVKNKIYGRVLRSHKDVKPIFISCGNKIDLQTTTKITLNLINNESRLPIPVRLADLETKRLRTQLKK